MNEHFGPKHVCWDITSACNDSCRFCYRVTGQHDLKPAQHFLIAEKFVRARVRKVSLVGGEPLLIPHLQELLRYFKNSGVSTSIVTNGILLESRLPDLKKYLDWITLPLDGHTSTTQTAMSRNRNHFNRVLHVYPLIAEQGIRLKINSVISAQNLTELSALTDLLVELRPDRWKIFEFSPVRGAAKKNSAFFTLPHCEFLKAADTAAIRTRGEGVHVTIADKNYLDRNYFSVSPNGEVRVTVNGEDRIAGDLLLSEVSEVWNRTEFDHQRHWIERSTLPPAFYERITKPQLVSNLLGRLGDCEKRVTSLNL